MQTGYLQHINSTPHHHHCWVDRSQVCHACKLQNSPNLYRTDCKHTRSSRHVVFCCVRKPSTAGQTHALIASIRPKDMPVLENCTLANLATAGGWHWLRSNRLDTSGGCPCRYRVKRPRLLPTIGNSFVARSMPMVLHAPAKLMQTVCCHKKKHEHSNCTRMGVTPFAHDLERFTHT